MARRRARGTHVTELEHAALVGAPTATIINADGGKTTAAAPVVNGTTIKWTGKLDKGERVELVYTVQVNADAASVTLKNVVTSTATPPGGGELVPPPGTTTHEVPPPPKDPDVVLEELSELEAGRK